jgi:hypothetical protein
MTGAEMVVMRRRTAEAKRRKVPKWWKIPVLAILTVLIALLRGVGLLCYSDKKLKLEERGTDELNVRGGINVRGKGGVEDGNRSGFIHNVSAHWGWCGEKGVVCCL